MSRIFSLAASGKRIVLELEGGFEQCIALKAALANSRDVTPALCGKIMFNDRNKKRAVTECMPISGALSVICVNERAKEFFASIDSNARFTEVEVVDESTTWHVYTTLSVIDAVLPGDGVESLLDGKRRLRSPRFSGASDLPSVFRLPTDYEASESLFCADTVLAAAKRRKITGLSFWDYASREETTLV